MSAKPICLRLPATLAAAVVLGACGDEPSPVASTTTVPVPAPGTTSDTAPGEEAETEATKPGPAPGPAETATEDPRVNALERDAERTARRYVEALDARDGDAVCALLAPGALAEVELPAPSPDCAAALEASIGYRDPRGLPVWEEASVAGARVTELDRGSATVVATVVTRFADRAEDSIEDDVIYLTRAGGRWLVAKASSTLYRAVGIADVPPSVLSPPS